MTLVVLSVQAARATAAAYRSDSKCSPFGCPSTFGD